MISNNKRLKNEKGIDKGKLIFKILNYLTFFGIIFSVFPLFLYNGHGRLPFEWILISLFISFVSYSIVASEKIKNLFRSQKRGFRFYFIIFFQLLIYLLFCSVCFIIAYHIIANWKSYT